MTNKEHPHAEVLRAIADGVPLGEFEASWCNGIWSEAVNLDWFWEPSRWEIRRKPQYIIVNGFKVPKPLDVMPEIESEYFQPAIDTEDLYWRGSFFGSTGDLLIFNRRTMHSTEEAAIAHAKAMLGIDPEYFK